MKIKYLFFILSVSSILLAISLLSGDEIPLKIITSPSVYSIKHTELNEQFTISILMNRKDTYHLDTQYIEKSFLKETETYLPISIERIEVSRDPIHVQSEPYYLVNFIVSLQVEMIDHIIEYEQASLEITYENEKMIDVYIGEFNYVFQSTTDDLSLYNLHGTFGDVNGINTVTGVVIELYNINHQNVTIQRIDIASHDVSMNNDYLVEKDREIDLFEHVEDVLLLDSYSFESYESTESPVSILKGQSKTLYIPLLYNDEIQYISRFTIEITYLINGQEAKLFLDDFIFMNQIHFGPEYESNYRVYDYEDHGIS